MPLTLRQLSRDKPFYEVYSKDEKVGVIQQFTVPKLGKWWWEITALRVPMGKMDGQADTIEEAKVQFAACWREWLERAGLKEE